jgi:hypothetical protein
MTIEGDKISIMESLLVKNKTKIGDILKIKIMKFGNI